MQQSVASGDDLRALIDDPSRRRDVSAVEVATAFLQRIEELQPRLHALITVTDHLALEQARDVDAARARGEALPLDGMPVVVKDVVDVAGVRATRGSRVWAERVAVEDAALVTRLRAAGAVILATANLHEVAFGGTSRNEAFGHVLNPWDPEIVPGGSSGGSGAAVAADLCIAAIGTDTGGSVRIPASCCGVAGIRPTYGAVPMDGVYPVSESLDTAGPLARRVDDLRAVLAVMAGHALGGESSVAGLRIGLPREFFFDDLDREVALAVEGAAETLAELGAKVSVVELHGGADAAAACGPLVWAEALAVNRELLERTPDLLEEGTRRRLALGEGVDRAELLNRMKEWRGTVLAAFEEVDVLLTPTLRIPPPPTADAETVSTTAHVVPLTFAISFARVPALSVPCGLTAAGHPIGVQLVAPEREDGLLLGVGAAYQSITDWHRRRPPMV